MSKKAFWATMVAVAVLASAVMIIGACASRKSEEEVKEVDTYIESIERVEYVTTPTTTAETTTKEVPQTTASAEELADMVLTRGLNGDDRKAELGDRYEEVQRWIDENYIPPETSYRQVGEADEYAVSDDYYEYPASYGVLNPTDGINYYGGVLETYYNMDMAPLIDLLYDLGYSGTYWIRSDGVKMFGDYIIVAADYSYEPRGTIVETSLGLGMVLDTGEGGWGWHDIATNWGH